MALKFTLLTRANMRQSRPGETLQEHGILFERLENGDGRFRINLRIDRQRIHRVIGLESDGVTREKVEEVIEKLRTEAREDRLNLPKGRKTFWTFREACEQYLQRLREEGGNNLKVKERQMRQHLIPYFGMMGLERITTSELERYKKQRREQGMRPATINRELAVISHLFNKALEWKWIQARPGKINRLAEENVRITYLTEDQSAALLEATREHASPSLYLFTSIALETSMRKHEILEIRLDNIDLDRHLIFIPHAKRGPREQPITRKLAELLRPHLELAEPEQVWLFPSKGSASGHLTTIERAFREAVRRAGLDVKEVCRHTLRHTVITHLVQAGVDLPTVQRISGHKTLHMVMRYAHQNGAHVQAAMDKLETRMHGRLTEVEPVTPEKPKEQPRERRQPLTPAPQDKRNQQPHPPQNKVGLAEPSTSVASSSLRGPRAAARPAREGASTSENSREGRRK